MMPMQPPGPMGPPPMGGMPPDPMMDPMMAPQAPGMTMNDLAAMPMPDGVELWGNPVMDAPPIDEAMFAQWTSPHPPLGGVDMGGMDMGMTAPASPQETKQTAMKALAQKAQARMSASQGFQAMAEQISGPKY